MYEFKECSSCGALYNKDHCCSVDTFVRDPNKTPDLSKQPLPNCPNCRDPVEGLVCRPCAFVRKRTPNSFDDSQNFPDHPAHYEPIWCDICGNDARYGHYCTPQVPNLEPCYDQYYGKFPQTLQSLPQQYPCCEDCGGPHATFECPPMNQNFHDSNSFGFDQIQPPQFPVIHQAPQKLSTEALHAREDLINSIENFLKRFNRISFRDNPKVLMQAWDKLFEIKHAQPEDTQDLLIKLVEDVRSISEEFAEFINIPTWNLSPSSYDDDDDEESSIPLKDIIMSELPPCVAITPALYTDEPVDSLIIEDEHLDTIPETESDEFIKSSVENLVPTPSESEDFSDIESECDVPDCDDSQTTNFSTFSNPLFDDSTSSDDESSHEEVIHAMSFKTYSNPLFDLDEEIISSEFNPIHNEDLDSTPKDVRFDAESYLLESLVNHDTLMASPPKIDFILDEFAGELTRLQSIPPRIDNINLDPESDILFLESLLYDNSSPRPPKAFQDNSNTIIESLPTFPIPVEDSDSLREEINIFPSPDDSIPSGIESDDFDSEDDNNSTSLPEFDSFHIFVASYGTVLASCQYSTLCVRKYCVSELSSCAGSELGSELTLLASSELKTNELDTSEFKTSEYKFLKIFILASYEQELCQFNFLPASCQVSSSELHPTSYKATSCGFLDILTKFFKLTNFNRTDFASWQQRIRLYYWGKENGVNILKSIDEGPFQMGTFRETLTEGNEGALHLGPERPRVYYDLSPEDKERYNADIRATNILLQGLPKDIYSLINHYNDAKDIWDNLKMLLEGSELTKEDRKSQLMQLNSKFVNNMFPEWGRFIIAVNLNRGLRDSNYDQLYAYLKQHEAYANENKMMLERFTQPNVDPLALMSNVSYQKYNSQSSTNTSSTYGRHNSGQGNNAWGAGAAGYGGAQNIVGNANPYVYVVAAFQAPPSPDYFKPPEDEVLPAKEQPLPTAASPTADSPGYVPESDPEEDPEEDDDEDLEEDPANYPADGGDNGDDEDESSYDEEDDDVYIKEEEEHPAPAESTAIALPAVEKLLAIPTPPPLPLSPRSSPLPQIPSPPLPQIPSPPLPLILSPLPVSPPLP
ncbi:hypothetical protein Tco_1338031 [Tanacetum coccineum]